MDDDEEILISLAETLNANFMEYIGGALFAPHLFKPLEKLCEIEETVVRDKVRRIFKLNKCIGGREHQEHSGERQYQRPEAASDPNDRTPDERGNLRFEAGRH